MKSSPITLQPFTHPVNGSIQLPGSKSITNRALILAALCQQPVTLQGALFSDDTRYMVEALRTLGLKIDSNEAQHTLKVAGQNTELTEGTPNLFVGNAGTAARFLTAFLTARSGGSFKLDGSAAMRKRPMKGLLQSLESIGAAEIEFLGEAGFFPFQLKSKGLQGGDWQVDASASSQILSALLMIAPMAKDAVKVELAGKTVSHPFISMTLAMMEQFGQKAEAIDEHGPFHFSGEADYALNSSIYSIEPDATAASYFMMLPWVAGGRLTIKDTFGITLQGDIRFKDVLNPLGAFFSVEDDRHIVAKFKPHSAEGIQHNFNPISDTFLTLAALSPLLSSKSTISGIAHTRHQETDRIAAMATELKKLGQHVYETEDSLTIEPNVEALKTITKDKPIEIDTYEDHRVAMSFGILGCHNLHGDGRPWITINDPLCCAKTFPHFFDELARLRALSL